MGDVPVCTYKNRCRNSGNNQGEKGGNLYVHTKIDAETVDGIKGNTLNLL